MTELRSLKACDIFPMIQILNKVGFRKVKDVLTPEKISDLSQGKDSTVLGFNIIFDVAGLVMENLPSCEQDLYRFLSGLSGLSEKEIADLPMSDFAEMVIAVIQKPEFKDFFKAVAKLLN